MLSPVGIVATFGAFTLFVNPVAVAFYKSSNTRAVYIANTLNQDLEIISSKERENIFYVIQDYLKKQEIKRFVAADVFRYEDYFVFGMLDKRT